MDDWMRVVLNEERRKVLRELAMLDDHRDTLYDRLTRYASQVVKAPISLMSMVDADYQFFKSEYGLPEPRQTALSHSFCKHVVGTNEPLIVSDSREHPIVKDNPAVKEMNMISYLGMPLTLMDGNTLGSFCVLGKEPRQWSSMDIDIMRELSLIVTHEIDLRALANRSITYQAKLEAAQQTIHDFLDHADATAPQPVILTELRALRSLLKI